MRKLVCVVVCVLWCVGCKDRAPEAPVEVKDSAPDQAHDMTRADLGVPADSGQRATSDMSDVALQDKRQAWLEGLTHQPLEGWNGCESWQTEGGESKILTFMDGYDDMVPRLTLRGEKRGKDMYHEGHNVEMRGKRTASSHTLFKQNGQQIALNWRQMACGMKGFFVLRDSMFSQQDHPIANDDARALILPPAWVTKLAYKLKRGEPVANVSCAPMDDDDAWRVLLNGLGDRSVFGDFPESSSLNTALWLWMKEKHDVTDRRARNARHTMCVMHEHIEALMKVGKDGDWKAVIDAGAERIAWGDREYFGEDVRRDVIVPIFVESPDKKEIGEGKGLLWPEVAHGYKEGEDAELEEILSYARRSIYGRRLEDGAMALERYDISDRSQREHVAKVLEELVPKGAEGEVLWVWVTGELEEGKKLKGEDAVTHLKVMKEELVRGDGVNMSRVKWLSKPAVHVNRKVKGRARHDTLLEEVKRHRAGGFEHVSVTDSVSTLHALEQQAVTNAWPVK